MSTLLSMSTLLNLPIRRKLTLIMMLTTCLTLVLACAAFVAYEQITFRDRLVRDLETTAEMTAVNTAAETMFADPENAEQTLKALRAYPHIMRAHIYANDGTPFAAYNRDNPSGQPRPPLVREKGFRFEQDRLAVACPIVYKGEKTGTLYMESDLRELQHRFRQFTLIVALVFVVAALTAYALTSMLQGLISRPISHLACTAALIAAEKNYSVRAVKQSEDELGRLIDGFNEMLSQIQRQDSALQSARQDLERRVEERTRELAGSLSLLNATIESTADGILAVSRSGAILRYNSHFVSLWAVPPVLLATESRGVICHAASQLVDSRPFVERIEQLSGHPETEAFDVLELKDGRTFECLARPQRIDQECVGTVFNFRDVTERKRSEARLEEAHRELVKSSRHAGMAEVATSVLHNVGNVLNSVNISGGLLADRLAQSRIGHLTKVAALLREHTTDLADFITRDDKGKQLLPFIERLAEHLEQERSSLLREVELLCRNIDHIKQIVAMQQGYAKAAGLTETFFAEDLVEDALRINANGLEQAQIRIQREYDPTQPKLTLDRHKALQILVNLVSNAKHACVASCSQDKRLCVRVTRHNGSVEIAITDNGVGISPKNLTSIFSHGFTTRKDGHGFGLHSGALAAKDLRGVLSVQSQGEGAGATFTLTLPSTQLPLQ